MAHHLKRKALLTRWHDEDGRRRRAEAITSLRTRGTTPPSLSAPAVPGRPARAGADLRCIDLSGETLDGVDLSGARLQGANLARCSLRNAKLTEANLLDAFLLDADLTGADLRGAILRGAVMTNTRLDGADLAGAVISRATLVAGTARLPAGVSGRRSPAESARAARALKVDGCLSVKALFGRQEIEGEIISLCNSLANHHEGSQLTLRQAFERFTERVDGDGVGKGCHTPTLQVIGELALTVPSWVAAHDSETRTVEGVLVKSNISHTEFPPRPWHESYDWNFHVRVDPQYTYLLSPTNGERMECEWETAFLPVWAWPQDGGRVWLVGRWIYDCAHPSGGVYRTEIHPPKAVASFRTEAVTFPGNGGPTRANLAVLYIGRDGGYWRQPINDQNYAFDLYLPPRPYPEAKPVWKVTPKTGTLPAEPQITPYPPNKVRALRVVIPLSGKTPHPEEYGAVIAAGWTDPHGTESGDIERVRVTVEKIYMTGDYDTSADDWYVYVGVNGRWAVYENMSGDEQALGLSVDLDLHPDDRIHITACGFEAEETHSYMGVASGLSWEQISNPNLSQFEGEAIQTYLAGLLVGTYKSQNNQIGYLSKTFPPAERGTRVMYSDYSDYLLQISFESR